MNNNPVFPFLVIAIAFFWLPQISLAQCFDTVLDSQTDIDNFALNYPDCQIYDGKITIDGSWNGDPIYNLDGLSQLIEVKGGLEIFITDISNFSGLENLQRIGIELQISDNNNLKNFEGLEQLKTVDGYFTVNRNDNLSNFNGLNSLDSVNYNLNIYQNRNLLHLIGLENLKYIGNSLMIESNPSIKFIQGLEAIKNIENSIVVSGNQQLKGFIGFHQIKELENLVIYRNENLESLTSFSNVRSVNGSMRIYENPKIEDLFGFFKLTSVGDLVIRNNDAQKTMNGLQTLEEITKGPFSISEMATLENLDGLDNLKIINSTNMLAIADCDITDNPKLESISSLKNLTRVNLDLIISDNRSLKNIDGLQNLEMIKGRLSISYNNSLKTISFSELDTVAGYIYISHCDSLETITINEDIANIEFLTIRNNKALHTITGFGSVESFPEGITIAENPSLLKLPYFEKLTQSGGVDIWRCPVLESYKAFPALEQVDGYLSFFKNAPDNLVGFEKLKIVNGVISVRENENLTSMEGFSSSLFENLDSLLIIKDNPNLSYCSIDLVCNHISANLPTEIFNNATGCNSEEEINEICISSSFDLEEIDVKIAPNPVSNNLYFEFGQYEGQVKNANIYYSDGRLAKVELKNNSIVLEHFPPGVYFVEFIFEDSDCIVKKIIKI